MSNVVVTGGRGFLGAFVVSQLEALGATPRPLGSADFDLRVPEQAKAALGGADVVINLAARVGGILANSTQPADFIRDNLLVQTSVIDAAHRYGTSKFVFLGSSCIYPRLAPQPMREEYLLTGALEPTNDAYAIAKLAGIKMCQAYRRQYGFDAVSVLPTTR